MTAPRSASIDYSTQCTVCIDYQESGERRRIVYERPQMQIPDRPLTAAERVRNAEYPDDEVLTLEAWAIFSDMQRHARIGKTAELGSIFIARTAAAALEMNL